LTLTRYLYKAKRILAELDCKLIIYNLSSEFDGILLLKPSGFIKFIIHVRSDIF